MLTIRKMQESDLPEITQIERECFGGEAWSREDFYYRLTNGAFVNLTALWDNEIAGYITVTALSEASVDSIAVAPRFRRLKIASRLLGHALSGSFDRVFLEVRESNLPARALYKSCLLYTSPSPRD